MLIPIDFILNECLNSTIKVEGRRVFADIVGRGEPSVRGWQRNNKLPPVEALNNFFEHLEQTDRSTSAKKLKAIIASDGIFKEEIFATQWMLFCIEMQNSPFVSTFKQIYIHAREFLDMLELVQGFSEAEKLRAYRDYLIGQEVRKFSAPESIVNQINDSTSYAELKSVEIWLMLESMIYFIAHAEAEYLRSFNLQDSRIVQWALPQREAKKIRLPLRVFYGKFFDRLISRGHYPSLEKIAEKLTCVYRGNSLTDKKATHISTDSAWTAIRRAKYMGEPTSFDTLSAWFTALVPREQDQSQADYELAGHLLLCVFVAARIFDKVYREALAVVSEEQLLTHFQRYSSWFETHTKSLVS